jgi:ADP-ribose pyrophosphatase YjhB (NUDIX family)
LFGFSLEKTFDMSFWLTIEHMSERFKPYVAVLVFLVKDNSVLLMRRFNTGWADGQYTIPSGHVEESESASAAAIRETREEVGITIAPGSLRFASVLHRKNKENDRIYIYFFFVAEQWEGIPKIAEPDKCDEVTFVRLNDLPNNIVPFVKDAIDSITGTTHYFELGWKESLDAEL